MIVTNSTLDLLLEELKTCQRVAIDTEATGLHPYTGDKLFCISLATQDLLTFFIPLYRGINDFNLLPDEMPRSRINEIFEAITCPIYFANAKFDMAMLTKEGVDLRHWDKCKDIQVLARIERNTRMRLSLDALSSLVGEEKIDEVKKYVLKHKLYTWRGSISEDQFFQHLHYEQVPLDMMARYAESDALITMKLANYFEDRLAKMNVEPSPRPIQNVVDIECKISPILHKMETRGVLVDKIYTQKAYTYEKRICKQAEQEFETISGVPFKDSNKVLATAFSRLGLKPPMTEKGNPSFTDDVLEFFDHPLAEAIRRHRKAYKRAGTYYANILFLKDPNDILHCNFKQAQPRSGRMSCSDPNMQNIPKKGEDKSEYPARKCFIPRPGHTLFMLDYDQVEYRLMLDMAEEMSMIEKILNEGLDVHEATAQMLSLDRSSAKTINFALLYGTGIKHLAEMLKISTSLAKKHKETYFAKLRKVEALIYGIQNAAKTRGYVCNHSGRRSYFDYEGIYKAPNYRIQGGCADITKTAMINIQEFLDYKKCKTQMLLQVHDELVLEVPNNTNEADTVIPMCKYLMETAYEHKHLPMTVGVDYSEISWHDKKEWQG